MAGREAVRRRTCANIAFPDDVWRHIKYFLLREYWRRKYSEALVTLPRATVLSTWTRRFWVGFKLAPHPNYNTTYVQRSICKIMVDYESRDVYPGPRRPSVLGPQEAFYIVIDQR